ncbi:uncharacterized protein HMPREF1120_02885 [Exophiala dermatitidis NIH/UT8656]|uniref:Uncharacterized protein n=1 Tax=Exophiala dermatitidis (strain ATCC 34100 / CBS 525.76 / NIH/UT8656) TaxID=858893 RepID=H6BRD9_EXODN|nr:uncharacterized protein HMPREF1120_02885 [Exophiala dermatitidis NIH/UT8656]EHY54720.1 hypothetical protein HMPREF1120_02885 [Exophiala dermatitidis NIH/UT8656]
MGSHLLARIVGIPASSSATHTSLDRDVQLSNNRSSTVGFLARFLILRSAIRLPCTSIVLGPLSAFFGDIILHACTAQSLSEIHERDPHACTTCVSKSLFRCGVSV